MPIKVSRVNGQDKQIQVPFGEDTLTLTYNRSKVTAQAQRDFQREVAAEEADNAKPAPPGTSAKAVPPVKAGASAMSRMLANILVSWDLVEEDGTTPLPLTADTLDTVLSLDALATIMRAVGADQSPEKPPSETSDDGF